MSSRLDHDDRAAPRQLPDCVVCGSAAWTAMRTGTRLRVCRGCGTVFNDRSSSRREEERIYDTYSDKPGSRAEHGEAVTIGRHQWRWLRAAVLPASSAVPPRVLDIGCGHGGFLRAAKSDGAIVAGIELDPEGAHSCQASGLSVEHGSIFDVGAPKGPWDLVTLWDVLEHLEQPQEALTMIVPELAPGGTLVLRGRNADLHASFKVGYARLRPLLRRLGMPDLSCVHRWGFGPNAYNRLLSGVGLTDIRLFPGIPTPGDRSGALGSRVIAGAVKGAVSLIGMGLHHASMRRVYPFPSVLMSARNPRG